MSGTSVGFIIFGVMLALMVVRVPIGVAMFTVGAAGYVYLTSGTDGGIMMPSVPPAAGAPVASEPE